MAYARGYRRASTARKRAPVRRRTTSRTTSRTPARRKPASASRRAPQTVRVVIEHHATNDIQRPMALEAQGDLNAKKKAKF